MFPPTVQKHALKVDWFLLVPKVCMCDSTWDRLQQPLDLERDSTGSDE